MTEVGVVASASPSAAAASANLGSTIRALRERANTVLPGLYAWLTTVALPSVQRGAPTSARVTAFFALLALLAAPLFVRDRPLLARTLGIFLFVGLSLTTWLRLGARLLQNPNDRLLSALGAVAFMLYALGWGSLRHRGAVPEDGPHVIPGPPLQPRVRPLATLPLVFGAIVVAALIPVFLAFRVMDVERGLLAHTVAILAAMLTVTVGSRVALGLGQRRGFPSVAERLNAAALPLSLLALVFGLGFLWLVLR